VADTTAVGGLELMARIAGVDLPRQKHINIARTYIYGIGHPRAGQIPGPGQSGCDERRVQDLTKKRSTASVPSLRSRDWSKAICAREVSMNINSLIEIGSYRGFRHRRNLPGPRPAQRIPTPVPVKAPAREPSP